MTDSTGPSSVSFWRQDWNWYVQQQGWTRSFSEQDRGWTQRLRVSNSAPIGPGDQSAHAIDIAGQKLENLVSAQTGSSVTRALGADTSSSAISAPGNAPSGSLLNLIA
jgi:hypothetical protein